MLLIRWRFLLDALVVNSLIQNILILFVPFVEGAYKALLIHLCNVVDKVQQSLGGLNIRVLCDISSYNQHLVELT